MREHAPRRLEPGGHQHRGPVHRVEAQDVLADEVVVDGPPLGEARVVGRVADRGAVVEQRVDPHVRDVLRIPRQRHAPVDRRAAHREVLQTAADEAEHLVQPRLGLHRVGMLGVVREQPVGVARELEEVVLLDDVLDRTVRGSGSCRRPARPRSSTPRTRRSRGLRRCRARCRRCRRSSAGTAAPPRSGAARSCG